MTRYTKFRLSKRNKKKILVAILLGILVFSFLLILSYKFSFKNFVLWKNIEPKLNLSVERPFVGELYLKSTLGDETFSPFILDALGNAQKSIEIAIYSINIPEVVSLLEEKRKSGVEVTVIVPKNKGDDHDEVFANTGIKVMSLGKKTDDEEYGEYMHHKYILIDYGTPNAKLFFGSTNFTSLQEKYDLSFLLESNDADFIKSFKEEIDFLKNKKRGARKFFDKNYYPFASKINYTNGFVETWMSPGYKENSVKNRMLELIKNAESKIEILAWRFNDEDIYNALVKKAKEGLEIRVIADDYYFWVSSSKVKELFYLSQKLDKNIKVVSDSFDNIVMEKEFIGKDLEIGSEFNSFMHHHTLIIDDKVVVTGTNNWGINGFFRNDESVIVVSVDWMVKYFDSNFDVLYDQLKGDDLDYEIKNHDTENKKLSLKEEYPKNSKFIIYEEKSYPDAVGATCLEGDLLGREIVVPNNCFGDKFRIFILDGENSLVASSYINF